MKLPLLILGLLLFVVPSVQAKEESPTPTCIDHLKWQRWQYTSAHVNVQQALHEKEPVQTKWTKPKTQTKCRDAKWQAKMLRIAEQKHWDKLYYSKQGVKWIIRKRFRSQGRQVVLNAWQVVSCESGFYYLSWNGRDAGPWQIELSAHHEVSWKMATDPQTSTDWAWRASSHGHNFSPTWVCAQLKGIA